VRAQWVVVGTGVERSPYAASLRGRGWCGKFGGGTPSPLSPYCLSRISQAHPVPSLPYEVALLSLVRKPARSCLIALHFSMGLKGGDWVLIARGFPSVSARHTP